MAAVDPVSAIAKAVGDIVTTVGGIINTAQKTIAARYAGVVNSNQSAQDFAQQQELQFADIYDHQQAAKRTANIILYIIIGAIFLFTILYIFRKKG